MAYIDQYTLAQDPTFQNKTRIALFKAAQQVLGQPTPDSGQLAAARRIVDDAIALVPIVALLTVLDPTVAASAPTGATLTDPQLQTAVNTALLRLVR